MESVHTDIRVKWSNIGLMLHYLRKLIFEISVMNCSVFLFSLLQVSHSPECQDVLRFLGNWCGAPQNPSYSFNQEFARRHFIQLMSYLLFSDPFRDLQRSMTSTDHLRYVSRNAQRFGFISEHCVTTQMRLRMRLRSKSLSGIYYCCK